MLYEPKGPRDHQAGDCCEPKGPRDHQGDCCVNSQDQEITRRVIVAETLFVNIFAEHTQPFISAGGPFQESREGDLSGQQNSQEAFLRLINLRC